MAPALVRGGQRRRGISTRHYRWLACRGGHAPSLGARRIAMIVAAAAPSGLVRENGNLGEKLRKSPA